jgi:3',5'-cyclic AMP phosphodiesterase CpdA
LSTSSRTPYHNLIRRPFALLLLSIAPLLDRAADLTLPLKSNSVRLAVIGDSGTGEKPQFDVAQQMMNFHIAFPFDFVVMLGDNIYGGHEPDDFKRKFEDPYKALLDIGVKFYASLGNHDITNERFYKPFNMDGKRYYNFKRGNAEFFVLDSNYMDPDQLAWLEKTLTASNAHWKICYFHHPLYSDGKTHGPDLDLRKQLEPIFVAHGVNLVLAGHEHCYERIQPQQGIYYIVLGCSGQLRLHNLKSSAEMVKGFDTDRVFALMEIAGEELHFQTISRTGATVDAGILPLQVPRTAPNAN